MLGWVGMASYFVTSLNHIVQEGRFIWETLALQAGTIYSGYRSKVWHTPVVDLYNDM
jgi:hypothetical protein